LQHNCQNGNCPLTNSKTVRIERINSQVKALEVTHQDQKRYILNSCALNAIDFRQHVANLDFKEIEPLEWLNAFHEGLEQWKADKKKGKIILPAADVNSRVNPAFLI
jgi:hypothetical protein